MVKLLREGISILITHTPFWLKVLSCKAKVLGFTLSLFCKRTMSTRWADLSRADKLVKMECARLKIPCPPFMPKPDKIAEMECARMKIPCPPSKPVPKGGAPIASPSASSNGWTPSLRASSAPPKKGRVVLTPGPRASSDVRNNPKAEPAAPPKKEKKQRTLEQKMAKKAKNLKGSLRRAGKLPVSSVDPPSTEHHRSAMAMADTSGDMDVDAGKTASTPEKPAASRKKSSPRTSRSRHPSRSSSGSRSSTSYSEEDGEVSKEKKEEKAEKKVEVLPPQAIGSAEVEVQTAETAELLKGMKLEPSDGVEYSVAFRTKILDIAKDLVTWEDSKELNGSKLVRAGHRLVELGLSVEGKTI